MKHKCPVCKRRFESKVGGWCGRCQRISQRINAALRGLASLKSPTPSPIYERVYTTRRTTG